MAYNVHLPAFEGPLDLLLHLIDKAQINIYDIPIALLTEQYLEYMRAMQYFDMEIASEFLVMAATLVHIKSRMLLPKPPKMMDDAQTEEFENDPRRELAQRLIEYKQFKLAATELAKQQAVQMKLYSRQPLSGPWNDRTPCLEDVSLEDLITAFAVLLQEREELPALIEREEYTVQDKMREIVCRVKYAGQGVRFSDLFYSRASRPEIIAGFLALLELMRLRLIKVCQTNLDGEIMVYSIYSVDNDNAESRKD